MSARTHQWLFMACFPVALVLTLVHAWPAALLVFLVGTPLFWVQRNRAAMREAARASVSKATRGHQGQSDRDEFAPNDHPLVVALGAPGERFMNPVGVVDWHAYLGTLNQVDRGAAVASANRDLCLTTKRLIVLDEADIRALLQGAHFEPLAYSLADITAVRTMKPPGSRAGWELAVEVKVKWQDGGERVAGVWATQADKAESLARRIESLARQAGAAEEPPSPRFLQQTLLPESSDAADPDQAEFEAAWREMIDDPDSPFPPGFLGTKRLALSSEWVRDRDRTGVSALTFLADITLALTMGYRRDLLA